VVIHIYIYAYLDAQMQKYEIPRMLKFSPASFSATFSGQSNNPAFWHLVLAMSRSWLSHMATVTAPQSATYRTVPPE